MQRKRVVELSCWLGGSEPAEAPAVRANTATLIQGQHTRPLRATRKRGSCTLIGRTQAGTLDSQRAGESSSRPAAESKERTGECPQTSLNHSNASVNARSITSQETYRPTSSAGPLAASPTTMIAQLRFEFLSGRPGDIDPGDRACSNERGGRRR